jgi:hypothetical protein
MFKDSLKKCGITYRKVSAEKKGGKGRVERVIGDLRKYILKMGLIK